MSTGKLLAKAAHNHKFNSRRGMLERLFTMAFKGLVYPQIWEDPMVDMAALDIRRDSRIVTIASGGCNAISYLAADPEMIHAVDLNHHHIALTRLKLAALAHLPDHETLFRFLGHADERENIRQYERHLAGRLSKTVGR